CARDHVLFDYW
nr:immunoglobulin heavy chain junction region [Mus musculus]